MVVSEPPTCNYTVKCERYTVVTVHGAKMSVALTSQWTMVLSVSAMKLSDVADPV